MGIGVEIKENHIRNNPTPSSWADNWAESDVFQAARARPSIKYIYVATGAAPGTAHKWTYGDATGPPIPLGSFLATRGY